MKCKYPNSYSVLRARRRPPAPSARRPWLGRGAGVHATPFSQKKEVKGNLHKNSITTCHNWRRAGDNNPIRYLFYCPPSRSHTPTPFTIARKKVIPSLFSRKKIDWQTQSFMNCSFPLTNVNSCITPPKRNPWSFTGNETKKLISILGYEDWQ